MKDLTDRALNVARIEGARYADIRILDRREQVASVKNGNVDGIGDHDSQGFAFASWSIVPGVSLPAPI